MIVEGVVERVRYYNSRTRFSIYVLRGKRQSIGTGEEESFTIHANKQPEPVEGSKVQLEVLEKTDSNNLTYYQVVKKLSESLMLERVKAKKTLMRIKGIGEATASKVVAHFGDETVSTLIQNPSAVKTVPGLQKDRAELIEKDFLKQELLLELFKEYGDLFSKSDVDVLLNLEQTSLTLLNDSFYHLVFLTDVPFYSLDNRILSFTSNASEKNARNRLKAFIYSLFKDSQQKNKLFMDKAGFNRRAGKARKREDFMFETSDFEREIDKMVSDGVLVLSDRGYAIKRTIDTLKSIQNHVSRLLNYQDFEIDNNSLAYLVKDFVDRQSFDGSWKLSESQFAALKTINYQISIITGGPGTGKSLTIQAVYSILTKLHSRVLVLAPTGKASVRLRRKGLPSMTLHKALKIEPGKPFTPPELETDVVIVDESSMIDFELMEKLLSSVPMNSKLILVGDKDQLPPVGIGSPFAELIRYSEENRTIPTFVLDKNYRTDSNSVDILDAATAVLEKDLKTLMEISRKSDHFKVLFYEEDDQVKEEVYVTYQKNIQALPEKFKKSYIENTLILTPDNKLRKEINHTISQNVFGYNDNRLFEGMRIMNLENDYKKGVFNGEMGFITSLDKDLCLVQYDGHGEITEYTYDETIVFESAYAITTHKSQGSEAEDVFILMTTSTNFLWTKKMLYTAITRAKKNVYILAKKPFMNYHPISFAMNQSDADTTYLCNFLNEETKTSSF